MKRIVVAVLALCVGVSVLATSVRGDSIISFFAPWKVEFEEYDRIFVMTTDSEDLRPRLWRGDLFEWLDELSEEQYNEERLWLRSGLYYNTDPPISIYYVDEYLEPFAVHFSRCGRYFVYVVSIINFGGPDYFEQEVLRFFADGRQVFSYRMNEVMEDRNSVRFYPSFANWIRRFPLDHNPRWSTLSLQTYERTLTFDITTGEILSLADANNRVSAAASAAGAAIARRMMTA